MWIKIEHPTPDKPEVFVMADCLGIDPDSVVGKLIRVWIWADQHTYDGNAVSVTESLLDRIASVKGFAEAMLQSGWLERTDDGLRFTNFDRHNGKTAKTRALTAKRVANHREKGNAPSVTSALPEKRREREEKKENPLNPPRGKRVDSYSEDFLKFWAAFPPGRKQSKGAAWKSWGTAITIVAPETIIRRATEYAASDQGRGDFVKMPSTWLNQRCWEDDPESWRAKGNGNNKPQPQEECLPPLQPVKRRNSNA